MKAWGIGTLALGLVIAIGALFYDTSVATASSAIPEYGSMPTEVYNLGRLQQQLLLFISGIALSIAGLVLVAVATAIDQLTMHTLQASPAALAEPPAIQPTVAPAAPREMSAEELAEVDKAGDTIVWIATGVVFVLFAGMLLAFALIPHGS